MIRVSSPLSRALPAVLLIGCQTEPTAPQRQLSRTPAFGKTPSAPANPELVYGGISGGRQYLWVANADGSNATALLPLPDFWKPFASWGPGGDGTTAAPYRIAFSNGECHLERVDVTIDLATGRPVASNRIDLAAKFATPRWSCDPDWSPKGDRIAFVNLAPEPDGTSSLWVIDELGEAPPAQLYTAPLDFYPKWPCWSPDGSEIAFLEFQRKSPYQGSIKVLTVATGEVRPVLGLGVMPNLASPEWARNPETQALLFTSSTGKSSSNEVWRLDLRTLARTKLLLGQGATWSPTDDRFAFVTWVSGKLSIYDFATQTTTSLGLPATWPDWRRPASP